MDIQKILEDHELWLIGDENGKRANLRRADLSDANLSGANLSDADLSDTNLSDANLSGANLSGANLRRANLRRADLSDADLSDANLSGANLRRANLSDADLSDANLSGANLSDAENLLSAINYVEAHFERTADGYIVYKCFGGKYAVPDKWDIKPGSVIEEEVNPNRTNACGCGINVATLGWVCAKYPRKQAYKLLIRWEWLPGVVVPYNTDGKIRCARAEIIGEVRE